jgi:hypothetical protein
MKATYAPGRYVDRQALTATDDPTAGPWTFSGVAVAPGDILHMADGTPVLFTEDELRTAAATQADKPLTDDHPPHEVGSSPPRDSTIGRVESATFIPEKGVVYQARTHDADVAAGIHGESYDVSVHPAFKEGDRDPETGAITATDVQFTDMSVVTDGDSTRGTAQWGPSKDLAASYAAMDFDELLADTDSDSDADPPTADDPTTFGQRMADGFASALGLTADVTDGQSGGGDVSTPDDPGGDGSGRDADSGTDAMDRDSYIQTLTDEHDFDDQFFEDMSDERLETMHNTITSTEADQPTGGDGQDSGSGEAEQTQTQTQADDGTEAEAAAGMAREDAKELFAELRAAERKDDQIAEIIAYDEDYDESDREELEASSPTVVEKIHDKATTSQAGPMPGIGGKRSAVEASVGSDSDDDLDAFGTGVQ